MVSRHEKWEDKLITDDKRECEWALQHIRRCRRPIFYDRFIADRNTTIVEISASQRRLPYNFMTLMQWQHLKSYLHFHSHRSRFLHRKRPERISLDFSRNRRYSCQDTCIDAIPLASAIHARLPIVTTANYKGVTERLAFP